MVVSLESFGEDDELYPLHTPGHPFCDDVEECFCHQDEEAIENLQEWYNDGLISDGDRMRIYTGQTF